MWFLVLCSQHGLFDGTFIYAVLGLLAVYIYTLTACLALVTLKSHYYQLWNRIAFDASTATFPCSNTHRAHAEYISLHTCRLILMPIL